MMKKSKVSVLFSVLLLVTEAFNLAASRSLTDIRYRFTSCAASGQHGPPIIDCIELYEEISSPIMRDDLFVDFSGDENILLGAQGFRIPRAGVYNVTIAGAAGGRGVCNTQFGHGVVHNFQVNLSPDYELLIIVGQKGVGPCDTNADHFLCRRPPNNPDKAMNCSEQWYNWTRSLPSNQQDVVYSSNGGAGGGGASMIWAHHIENETFLELPLFVSAGGGGSPAILDYDGVKADIQTGIGLQFGRSQEAYKYHLNGRPIHIQSQEFAILNTTHNGNRGLTPNEAPTAGAGGGFFDVFPTGDTDGHPLSEERSTAEGGNNCINSILAGISNPNIFLETVGGFGGGGGGCGGGGGGGGYTGGSVFSSSNDFPGGGGYSAASSTEELTFPQRGILLQNPYQNDNNGYVEIVPVDCGCSDDLECAVNEDALTFECLCKNEDHILAENGFDCYKQTRVNVEQVWTHMFAGFTFKGFQLLNRSVLIYSVQLSLQLEAVDSQSVTQCVIVFIDNENNPILITNIVRTGGSLIANQLSSLYIMDNTISLSDKAYSILEEPELVSGVLLISNGGDCSISETAIPMNISTRRGLGNYAVDFTEFSASILSTILQIQSPSVTTETPPPPELVSNTNVGLIVGVVVALLVILVISSLPILIIVCWVQRTRRNKRQTVVISSGPNASSGALLPAVRYYEIDVPGASPMAKCDIIDDQKKDHAQGYSVVDYDKDLDHGMYDLPRDITMSTSQFSSKYDVIAPVHDFTVYNKSRIESATDSWQYPRSKLIYMRELGEGQFGKVLLMKAKGIAGFEGKIPVAVKTLTSRDPEIIDKFLEEAELMKKFTHPNIVSILGVSSEDDDDEDDDSAPLMILEYMPYGDLQNFMENHKPNELGQTSIKEKHFYSFATDIARALEFLTARKYIHRDVAARNCLVGPDLHIKIADFGMSRGVQDKEYYRIAGKAVLPVRWMSPEALLYGKFTAGSDVWAFGVTVWEIVSFGETPLEDMEVQEIIQAAQDKSLKHSKPPGCPDELYTLMCSCHIHNVNERISFLDILSKLENALKAAVVSTQRLKPVSKAAMADQVNEPLVEEEEEEEKIDQDD